MPLGSSLENYVSPREVRDLYDEIYGQICRRLSEARFKPFFSYQGVDLLWCFKKEIFSYAYTIALRQLLKDDSFASRSKAEPKNEMNSAAGRRTLSLWPAYLKIGGLKLCRTVVFSDPRRSFSVLKRLKKSGSVFLSTSAAPRILARAILERFAFCQIVHHSSRDQRNREQVNHFLDCLNKHSVFSSFHFREASAENLLQQKAERLFRLVLPRLLFEIDMIRKFFVEAKELKSALLDEDVDATKNAFCQLAKQFGVQTFVESHGALGDKHGYAPLTADRIFVWGDAQKNKLIAWGCSKDQIIVSGCSQYGQYLNMKVQDLRKKIAADFQLDPVKPIILLAFAPISRWHSHYEHRMKKIIVETFEVMADFIQRYGAQVILKLHPADENEDFYVRWLSQHHLWNKIKIIHKYDPLKLARGTDFLIVYGSTYAVDAFALDKPVVCLYDDSDELLSEYREFAVFAYTNGREDLRKTGSALLEGKYKKPERWNEAKKQCLNFGSVPPEDFIAEQLLKPN